MLGAIFLGLATPSKPRRSGRSAAIILAAAYRALTVRQAEDRVILDGADLGDGVLALRRLAISSASIFAYLGGQELIENFVTAAQLSPTMFLILAQLIIFVLGWPLEWTEIIVIFVPIFLPLLEYLRDRPAVLRHPRSP